MFIFHEEAFRIPAIQKRFYDKVPQTFSNLRKNCKNLINLRNDIAQLTPELYKKDTPHSDFAHNKDRMIIDMFEDIAVLNGWDYSELKSPWDIIREKYNFTKKLREENPQEDFDEEDNIQISIFDTLENQ